MSRPVGFSEPVIGTSELGDLYRCERSGLVRLARLLTGCDAVAEELVHDAFVRLYARPVAPENPGGYLHTVVVNLCRDYLRRGARARQHPVLASLPETPPEIDETWTAICRLPARQRAVVVLRYYQDLPEVEIARLLGCRPGTVKSSLSRALASLRKELSP